MTRFGYEPYEPQVTISPQAEDSDRFTAVSPGAFGIVELVYAGCRNFSRDRIMPLAMSP